MPPPPPVDSTVATSGADASAAQLDGCDEQIPLLGVTREFDFGQFIELFDMSSTTGAQGTAISRVVIQRSADLAADRNATSNDPAPAVAIRSAIAAANASAGTGGGSSGSSARRASNSAPLRGSIVGSDGAGAGAMADVGLFELFEQGPSAKQQPKVVRLDAGSSPMGAQRLMVGEESFKLPLSPGQQRDLAMGWPVEISATNETSGAAVNLRLEPTPTQVLLTTDDRSKLVASKSLRDGSKVFLPEAALGAVIKGQPVRTHVIRDQGQFQFVELRGATGAIRPVSSGFEIYDLASFLSRPAVYGTGGMLIDITLSESDISALIDKPQVTHITMPKVHGGGSVELRVVEDTKSPDFADFNRYWPQLQQVGGYLAIKPFGVKWPDISKLIPNWPIFTVHPYRPDGWIAYPGSGSGSVAGNGATQSGNQTPAGSAGSLTSQIPPRLPTGSGLPVAVFVPWRQTWTLTGFSRGNLLHSIALAPSEQVTMQVYSWERRSRSLEQSSETESESQTDISQSTRDSDDVFREMLAKNEFAWQLSGSVDATYRPGVATIEVQAGGQVSNTNSITQTAKNSSQSLRESTVKASSRVRSRRVTRVTQSVESGREERVTRVIRNPNACHTLTLDFFETLAHYEIKLEFVPSRMRLVVLIPNPIKIETFSSELVRRNETTLRNALLEDALVDGFEACRYMAAYAEAVTLQNKAQTDAAKQAELMAQRDRPAITSAPAPSDPQEQELLRTTSAMIAALKSIRGSAQIDPSLYLIAQHKPVDEESRRKAQHWLFITFCAARFPALLQVLDELSEPTASASIASAQRILSVLPGPDEANNLGNLNDMAEADKERIAYGAKLKEEYRDSAGTIRRRFMLMDWDWGWWMERLRDAGLMTCNDAGLAGMSEELQRAFQAWEAKKAQGAAMKDQEVAKAEAEGRQDKATTADQLSMAFPLEDLARASERSKTLLGHLDQHRDFYAYAMFQALPPTEQTLKILEAGNGRLQVGMFEPRVVAMSGNKLVVPLTPLAGSETLRNFVTGLATSLETTFAATSQTPEKTVLPTPGVSVFSRLGKCSACEDSIVALREAEVARAKALARQAEAEAVRREKLLGNANLAPFEVRAASALDLNLHTAAVTDPPTS